MSPPVVKEISLLRQETDSHKKSGTENGPEVKSH